ncbi:MAG: insulinase family protein [Oscillospiraceae bacterium]|nr:insulinase family protein [Oscillospiraceae bacterium]
MQFHIGDSLYGFSVTRIRHSEELGGQMVEMVYPKTGTELVWIDNQEENKTFSIAFKTLPEDSTGVFHILEHSVLCGSRKYPVREPFVELLKSSMNTFLNAMTFPDKTMYPVSSRNGRDFLNLTEVYLDAVFAPAILQNPNIFYQEGCHIEENEDGTLSYKGVVFNEMKGALSDAEDLAEYKLQEMMFADNAYGFNSGGNPAVIPSLTYEQFKETYLRFYHPSNAKVFLDGDIPLEDTLQLIASYLSQYEKSDNLPECAAQQPKSAEAVQYYELGADEELTNKELLTIGKIVGTWEEHTKILAYSILFDTIAGSNDAPLKREILSAGVAQEMWLTIDGSIPQPYYSMGFQNVTDGRADEILPLVQNTARSILKNGVDKDALRASANILEFRLLEPSEPQGIGRCVACMNSWLHGGDPMMYLVYQEDFALVRKMIDDGAFDTLLEELLVNDDNLVVVHTLPSYTQGEALRQDEAKRLADIRESWDDAALAANRALNEGLLQWQQTPDTPEQLATLPQLPLSEVNDKVFWNESTERSILGIPVLFHKVKSNIVHFALEFRLTNYTLEDFPMLSIMDKLLTELPTANYTALELQQKLKNTVGRFSPCIKLHSLLHQTKTTIPVFSLRCSVLREQLDTAFDLIMEVLQTTDFTQKEKIREILQQMDERSRQFAVRSGHTLALSTVASAFTAKDAVDAALNGAPSIQHLHDFMKDFDNYYEKLRDMLQTVQKEVFCQSRMMFASVSSAKDADLEPLLRRFPVGTAVPEQAAYHTEVPARSGNIIPAQIGFAIQGACINKMGMPEGEYNHQWRVAAKIITLGYLWNMVRVQGGAYGTGLILRSNGSMFTYSFRDPSPARTLDVNRGISDFIRSFCESDESVDKYIISTVSETNPLMSAYSQGVLADDYWAAHITEDYCNQNVKALLSTTKEDLLATCNMWEAFATHGLVCVYGSENQLADCENLTITK